MPDDVLTGIGVYADPTANSIDVITLAEAKHAIRYTGGGDDDSVIAMLITAVSRRLDQLCGPIVKREFTETLSGGTPSLFLENTPVDSIDTVTEYWGDTGTVIEAETAGDTVGSRYLLDTRQGRILRRWSAVDSPWLAGTANVVVTGTAGRYDTTADVDQLFKQAASFMVANLFRREQGGATVEEGDYITPDNMISGFAVPNAVLELLAEELKGPNIF